MICSSNCSIIPFLSNGILQEVGFPGMPAAHRQCQKVGNCQNVGNKMLGKVKMFLDPIIAHLRLRVHVEWNAFFTYKNPMRMDSINVSESVSRVNQFCNLPSFRHELQNAQIDAHSGGEIKVERVADQCSGMQQRRIKMRYERFTHLIYSPQHWCDCIR